MCGICGIISASDKTPQLEAVKKMCASMVHRGPDEEGYYCRDNVALGTRRLAIIDLAKGNHPIHNEDKTLWVVLNGFIYNYRQLRKGLEAKGHRFYTGTDTEVLVHLYEEHGFDCVKHLNGMFAFAIWDDQEKVFSLYRDKIGVKSIFYSISNGELIFGSEMKSILSLKRISKDLDFQALDIYFSLYYIPAPFTVFKHIRRLSPAHYLVYKPAGEIKEYKYWEFSVGGQDSQPESYYQERVIGLLEDSIRRQLQSDVPVGLFLSGGIDSTAILALVNKVTNGNVKSFSIGFSEESYNELDQARIVAQRYSAQHHEVVMDAQTVPRLLPKIIAQLDEPNGDWSSVPNYLVSQLAKAEVTVALCGAGGDELFAGYPTYTAYYLADLYRRLPHFLKESVIKKVVERLPVSLDRLSFDYKAKAFVRGADADPIEAHFRWKEIFAPEAKAQLYSELGKSKMSDFRALDVFLRYSEEIKDFDALSRLLFLDTRVFHAACTLYVTDITTMAHSLECRVPFLDNELIDFAWRIPSRLKHKGWTTKYILRQAVKGLLPKEIVKLKKRGFILPSGPWISGPLQGFVRETLSRKNIEATQVLNADYCLDLLGEHLEKRKDNSRQITSLVSFILWHDQYIKH